MPSAVSTSTITTIATSPTNDCHFVARYYCGSPPSAMAIFLDTLRLTLYLAIAFAIAYLNVYIIAYLERRKILRELYERRGQKRHYLLMGMFEGMGWENREVREWKNGMEGAEMRDFRDCGRDSGRGMEDIHFAQCLSFRV
jgi:hypothetical protein